MITSTDLVHNGPNLASDVIIIYNGKECQEGVLDTDFILSAWWAY